MTSREGSIPCLLLPGGSSDRKLRFFERVFSALVLGGTISTASIESASECRNLNEIYGAKITENKGYK